MSTLLGVVILFILLVVPWILTVLNIINLFKKKRTKENFIDILTIVLGFSFTMILYCFLGFKDYTEPLRMGSFEADIHTPIASWSMPTVMAICTLGVISYILIRTKNLDLPPLIVVGCMSCIFICSAYMILFIIQISNNVFKPANLLIYFMLFPTNYILCSIRAVIVVMKRYKEKGVGGKREYNNKLLNKCNNILNDIDKWPIIAIILAIPILAVLICILVLFGQRPDEAIKAFLDTSDWTLSQKISPPPIEYDGHYLCTVSIRGHKNLVKPTRMGIRRGERIVVNRQLCIANAFEDLIKERTPRFHHFIRHIYDKYGYPISKHINNAWQADITYIIMKPLEWMFLIALYLFDRKPENRISTQYIGKKVISKAHLIR